MSDATGKDAEDLPTDTDESTVGDFTSEYESEWEEESEPEHVTYDSADFISKPFLSEDSTVPENILDFQHSFSYECLKYFNICVADEHTIVFASGNLLHFYDVSTKTLWFRRSYHGGGIGSITRNPQMPHIAVGEKGKNPYIIIYDWPSMDIVSVLKGGSTRSFSCMNYSPDGNLLCSQGGDPDYFLTIWNWKKSQIMRQQKAYVQEIFNVMFSPYLPGRLTTAGLGHIKFWKMANTFTGLKLAGSLGRFGKTEISDVVGFLPLPDEQVISGCEWGNLLLWNEGLIKLEVCGMDKTTCHQGPIVQVFLDKKELVTVGQDGIINTWYFDTIDKADPTDEDFKLEMKPYNSYEIGSRNKRSKLMCIVSQHPEDPNCTKWFAQDGNGRIWTIDLLRAGGRQPEEIFFSHAGAIADIATSPCGPYFASLGVDGRIFFYNYLTKKLLFWKQFSSAGGCLLWVPLNVDRTGCTLIAGFSDGVLRILYTSIDEEDESHLNEKSIALIQIAKPHTEAITQMLLSNSGNILVTGSEDATVFVFQVLRSGEYVCLEPIGFIPLPSAVVYFSWRDELTLMMGTKGGDYIETTVPELPVTYTTTSYQLTDVKLNTIKFKSVKSQIRRDILLKEIEKKKEEKLEKKKEELKRMHDENPHLDIDENTFLEDSEPEEDLGPLYYPEVPNAILFATYVTEDIIWLSVGGYDAGYMYEYSLGNEDPIRSTMIFDADDIEINTFLYSDNKEYLIFGMQDGKIRINRVREDYHDLRDYWLLPMHDNDNGIIRRLCFSYDNTYLFSCGNDGNIFSYLFLQSGDDIKTVPTNDNPLPPGKDLTRDITDPKYFSIEQAKLKDVYDKKMRKANSRKESVLRMLSDHQTRFINILSRSKNLPESQMISQSDFELDPRITEDLEQELGENMNLMHRKLAFQVEKSTTGLKKLENFFINNLTSLVIPVYGIRNPWKVTSFRQVKLGPLFHEAKNIVAMKLEELRLKNRVQETAVKKELSDDFGLGKVKSVESFLKGVNINSPEFQENKKLVRLLDNYFEKKSKLEKRKHEWYLHEKRKPDPNVNHPDDVAAIEIAKETIGNFNLKSSPDYSVSHHLRITTLHKYDELLAAREKLHHIKYDFNSRIYKIRDTKMMLMHKIKEWSRELINIHAEIEPEQVRPYSEIIPFNQELEYPECLFLLNLEDKEVNLINFDDTVPGKSGYMDPGLEVLLHEANAPKVQGPFGTGEASTTSLTRYLARQFKLCSLLDVETLIELFEYDSASTPWEEEFKEMRKIRKLFEQDQIHAQIDGIIQEYDDEVKEAQEQKIDVIVSSKVQELDLLSLHQELIIIKEFEATEDNLSQNVLEKIEEKSSMTTKVNQLQAKIDSRKREIDNMTEKMKQLGTAFTDAVADDSFADFLKRIYKKKYKVPKVRDTDDSDDESSSSSDESSSDEDMDEDSLASEDLGAIKLDESICPPGCRRDLYDLTFNLRSQRYVLEQDLLEEKKQIDNLKKEQEQTQKKIKSVEVKQKQYEEELQMYQREKQKRLNEIDYAVLVHLSQMQYFNDSSTPFANLQDKLLFSENALERLFHRVGELEKETIMAKEKHKFDKQHRQRMRNDCNYMAKDIVKIKSDITECMMEKFGRIVNLDEIEQYVLRKNISGMQSIISDFRKLNDKKIALMQDYVVEKQEYLSRLICQNTEKLNILTVLEEEKNYLIKILRKQEVKVDTFSSKILAYSKDIKKLKKTIKDQEYIIQALKREMYNIKHNPVPATSVSQEILPEHSSEGHIRNIIQTVIEAKVDQHKGTEEASSFITEGSVEKASEKTSDSSTLVQTPKHLRSIEEGPAGRPSQTSVAELIAGLHTHLVHRAVSVSGGEEFMEDQLTEISDEGDPMALP